MGVKGLWRLLLPIGRRISIETLEGKTLAIDASIWLTQFLKAMRDPETGKLVRSAHLVGFFRRICRLRFHRIRPIFVFDGATPEIKRAEVLRRKRKRDTFAASLDQSAMQRLAKKILTDKLRKVKVQKAGNVPVTAVEAVNNEQKSGLEPGFNPGCQGLQSHDSTEGAQDVLPIDDMQDSKPAAIESEFIDLINEVSAASVGNKVSDWDLPLTAETSLEAVEPNDPHEDSETRFFSAFSIEDGSLAVDMVSSLSTELERKNAVELARKQQRMQSRREFMPAAANPQDFSSVQMRNFLKYCKLNRDIASMAKRVAEQRKNDAGPVAYSTTSRIELVQDEDNNEITLEDSDSSDYDGSGPAPLLQQKLSNLRSKRVQHSTVRSKKVNNDDSDDESLDETSNDYPTLKARQNRPIILDSDDDDEEETVNPALSKVGVRPSFIDDSGLELQLGTDLPLSGGFLPARMDVMDITALACSLSRTDEWGNEEASDYKLTRILQEEQDGLLAANVDEAAINCKTDVSKKEKLDCYFTEKICDNESAYSESDKECTDDIDWEDGSDQGDEVPNLPTPLDKTNILFDEGRADGAGVDVAITISESPIDDSVGNDFERIHKTQDTMDALKQAEATASNLADWAGRAFRRALKEVDQVQPHSPAEAQNVLLEDNSRDMNSVSSSREEVDQAYEENPKISTHGVLMKLNDKQDRGNRKRISPQLSQEISTTLIDDINWKAIRSQQEKETDTISEEMLEESKFLLRLFGIPYVEAPAEAEAQCAAMEKMGLVDGVVTEDSDAFVFGAQKVYKHIFDGQKYAEAYVSRDAEKEMNLNQNSMVALAMLLGGDYTEGVKGVGIVNAMELLEAYDVSENLEGGLEEFKKWLDGFDPFIDGPSKSRHHNDGTSVATRKKERFHEQHKSARTRWVAPINFPSKEVMKAYLEPVVDQSTDDFSWGTVDEDNLVKFCEAYMGWDADETRRLLKPVLDAQKPGLQQRRIDSYMRYEDSIKFGEIQSKRLQAVLRRKTQTSTSETSADSK